VWKIHTEWLASNQDLWDRIPWITTFILLDKTVYLLQYYEKATLSSYEKNAVYAAFPPYSDRIFKMRKCVVSASGN